MTEQERSAAYAASLRARNEWKANNFIVTLAGDDDLADEVKANWQPLTDYYHSVAVGDIEGCLWPL